MIITVLLEKKEPLQTCLSDLEINSNTNLLEYNREQNINLIKKITEDNFEFA